MKEKKFKKQRKNKKHKTRELQTSKKEKHTTNLENRTSGEIIYYKKRLCRIINRQYYGDVLLFNVSDLEFPNKIKILDINGVEIV